MGWQRVRHDWATFHSLTHSLTGVLREQVEREGEVMHPRIKAELGRKWNHETAAHSQESKDGRFVEAGEQWTGSSQDAERVER